jgi:aryl-alcohol dehydrogenase-like predicted oxidoreductase
MKQMQLGRTGIPISKDGFGALPIQRRVISDAIPILQAALDAGITFFDTARVYTDSEEKIGLALSSRRSEFILATKTPSLTADGFWNDLETSLRQLKTDYIDIYQFHNPQNYPRPGDGSGLYEAMLAAKQQGKIRFIGITNHRLQVAEEAVKSGLYDTLQFPFSYLSDSKELALVQLCREKNIGFIAMKALSGGLITDIAAACAWMAQHTNVVPIWGIQHKSELDELIAATKQSRDATAAVPPALSDAQKKRIEHDRAELIGEFCRGCGYCLPCPAGIEINTCARISLFIRRAPPGNYRKPEFQAEMAKILDCKHCGHCKAHCPYGLDTPALLEKNYRDYQDFLRAG